MATQVSLLSGAVASAGSLLLQTNGTTTQATIDTSGNLGLGVTPSAWQSGRSIIELGGSVTGQVVFNGSSNNGFIATNVYNSGSGNLYKNSSYATSYNQTSGQHQWYTAASGTAGNAITFTQAMTLDASGNLGIGTTTTTYRVNFAQAGGGGTFYNSLWQAQSAGNPLAWNIDVSSKYITSSYGAAINCESGNGAITFYNAPSGTAGASATLTERARIDSSGNLLVGNTSATPGAAKIQSTFDGSARNGIDVRTTYTGGTSYLVSFFNNASSNIGSITTNGSTTAYNTSSDYRLKENIAPMVGALSVVAQLKPCTYTWKADGTEGQGFIAHELQEVVPDAVTGEKDAVNEDGSIKPQGIDTSFLVATLTAAIQELKAEFDAYKASHP